MYTAFSTLGCPEWPFSEIFSAAKDLGYNGIEFRGVGRELYMPRVPEFTGANIAITAKKFSEAKLSVPVFSSGAVMDGSANAVTEAKDYIGLASCFGAKYIRVLADKNPGPSEKVDEGAAVKSLKEVCAYAESKNVSVLIETNGVYSDSGNILSLIKKADSKNLFIIWDLHHTCRYGKEKPADTLKKLGGLIRHVHIKDSKIENGALRYALPGNGDIPIKEAVTGLKKAGYGGFLCLEWVKRWSSELAEAGIVFPNFIFYIRDITG